MSGPFYGSLAASAAVFVAILTALLVNNYVRIKSERRQTQKELNRVEEELEGLQDRKEGFEDTIQPLVEKRESDFIQKAEEQVDEFIGSEVFWNIVDRDRPIEKLAVDELYQKLLEFHDCESPKELEKEPFEHRHRDILEERMDEVENKILENIIPLFASQYEGEGWESDFASEVNSLEEAVQKRGEQDTEEESEIETDSENGDSDVLDLDGFTENYKEEYGLNSLANKTLDKLEHQYNKVVDKPPEPDPEYASGLLEDAIYQDLHSNPYRSLTPPSSLRQSISDPPVELEETQAFNEPFTGLRATFDNSVLGLNPQEEQELAEAQEELRDIDIEIKTLQQRKDRLEREEERLQPEDLNSTLYANLATIVLSVVVPIAAYLNTVTEFTITELGWINIWMIAGSWLLGLLIVFGAIYYRINNDE